MTAHAPARRVRRVRVQRPKRTCIQLGLAALKLTSEKDQSNQLEQSPFRSVVQMQTWQPSYRYVTKRAWSLGSANELCIRSDHGAFLRLLSTVLLPSTVPFRTLFPLCKRQS